MESKCSREKSLSSLEPPPASAGPIAKHLVDHPQCTQPEVTAFIASELSIVVDAQTLRRFLGAHGLTIHHPALRPSPRRWEAEAEVALPWLDGRRVAGSLKCRGFLLN